MNLETIKCEIDDSVATLTLNRPEKANAMNWQMWQDIRTAMQWADITAEIRAIVICGEGKNFNSGIDLGMMSRIKERVEDSCSGRASENLRMLVLDLQDTLTSIEKCRKPVIAAIHGGCVGGGLDLICCTDMRFASEDAYFSIKEIDIGMVADVGTLQRLPKIIGSQGLVRELAFTGRKIGAQEAHQAGLVNSVFSSREELLRSVMEMARVVASKSPLSIRGTKEILNYSLDHSVADGLNYVATWNSAMLLSSDLSEAMAAGAERRHPVFSN